LAKQINVDPRLLSDFRAAQAELPAAALDRLLEALGLRLMQEIPARNRHGGRSCIGMRILDLSRRSIWRMWASGRESKPRKHLALPLGLSALAAFSVATPVEIWPLPRHETTFGSF